MKKKKKKKMTPENLGRHIFHIPLGRCSGFKAKRHNYFFFFFFFFSLFFFERLIGLLFKGPDILKVVKSTRPDFCRA